MAASIEITYYNSYFGKRVINPAPDYLAVIPPWTGITDASSSKIYTRSNVTQVTVVY